MTLLTGILYPLLITAFAQLMVKQQADGDFLFSQEKVIGAKLIGQKFESDKYFWGRPSAIDYNPLPSGGSNLGPTSALLRQAVKERQENLLKAHRSDKVKIPTDLLFASGSGLDPHITISAAYFQIQRIAKARGLESREIKNLIDHMVINQKLGFLGENYVNVLLLNKALDEKL